MTFGPPVPDPNNPSNNCYILVQLGDQGADGNFTVHVASEPGYNEQALKDLVQALVDTVDGMTGSNITETYRIYYARQDVTPTGA